MRCLDSPFATRGSSQRGFASPRWLRWSQTLARTTEKRVSFIARLYVDDGPPAVYLSDSHYAAYDHMASLELLGSQAPILAAYQKFGWSYVDVVGVFRAFDGPETTRMRAGSLTELEIGGHMELRQLDTTKEPWLRLDQPE